MLFEKFFRYCTSFGSHLVGGQIEMLWIVVWTIPWSFWVTVLAESHHSGLRSQRAFGTKMGGAFRSVAYI